MKYMVVETFRPGAKDTIYARYEENGRMLPDGLHYIDSWLSQDGKRCFQLMMTEDPQLFELWFKNWSDLIEFEVTPLVNPPVKASKNHM